MNIKEQSNKKKKTDTSTNIYNFISYKRIQGNLLLSKTNNIILSYLEGWANTFNPSKKFWPKQRESSEPPFPSRKGERGTRRNPIVGKSLSSIYSNILWANNKTPNQIDSI